MATINEPRYINPYTDFGFKKLFGTELNKDLLISFLNALLGGRQVVEKVSYKSTEHFGVSKDSHRAIFDVFCENDKGEKFIVEMQNVFQQFFKDRSVFYSTFPIQEQGQVGEWDFHLKDVYTVGILNFCFPENEYERHRGNFPWMPHQGGLAKYLHKAIHEEWQVGHTPYLRAEPLHFRVE